jgi:hypothetical protein
MKMLRPITLTDAMLISSTIPEPDTGDPSTWSSGTTYAVDATVRLASTHRIYKSMQNTNLNHDPSTDDGTWWVSMGGTSRWAMFDEYVSTASSEAASPLTVTIAPGVCDSLYLYGMVGETATVTMTNGLGGPTVYSGTLDLLVPKVADWYAYYFEPYRQIPSFVLTDIPPYLNGHITLSITAASGAVSCGMMLACRSLELGGTQYGVRTGIRDYSKKVTDPDTGYTVIEQRKFAKTMQAAVRCDSGYYAELQQQLEAYRSTPCVWVGDSTGEIEPLVVYGYYKDMYLIIDYPTTGLYNLDIEGMV